MKLRPSATKASSRENDVRSSAVQPNTLPPKTSGATLRSELPIVRCCMVTPGCYRQTRKKCCQKEYPGILLLAGIGPAFHRHSARLKPPNKRLVRPLLVPCVANVSSNLGLALDSASRRRNLLASARHSVSLKGIMDIVQPEFTPDIGLPPTYQPLGLAALLREATAGNDLTQLGELLLEHTQRYDDPYALLEASVVLELKYQRSAALAVHALAIQTRRHYRLTSARSAQAPVKVLALKAPGDLMSNTPFECLLENADLQIEVLYVDRYPLQDVSLPEHDVILVAACASDENAEVLARIATLVSHSDRRVLNRPERIAHTTRDAAFALFGKVPSIRMAHTVRLPRERVLEAASGAFDLSDVVDGRYPFIVRPVGSHAGQGLVKVSDRHDLAHYLEGTDAQAYYLAPFFDYSDPDGLL